MEVSIDNVGIAMVCRNYKPKTKVRTFKAACGAYIRFTVEETGRIAGVLYDRNGCKQPCTHCETLTASARILIKSGK